MTPAHHVEAHDVGPLRALRHQLPGDVLEAHVGGAEAEAEADGHGKEIDHPAAQADPDCLRFM